MVRRPRQFEVYLVSLAPIVGHEISKTRPCLVVSPDEMNRRLSTNIIAPMTSTLRTYPTRVTLEFQSKRGQIALDQIRAVDRLRLVKHLGSIDSDTGLAVLSTLQRMFAPHQQGSPGLVAKKSYLHEPRPRYGET